MGYAGPRSVAEPLDERAGIPGVAATVDTFEVLKGFDNVIAQVVRDLRKVFLPSRRRPIRLERPYSSLVRGYSGLMKKARKSGLVQFGMKTKVAKHRKKVLVSGDFAVKKNETETRVITDVVVNQLLDEEKVPKPVFAYISIMHSYTVKTHC